MIRATYSDFITAEDGRIVRHVVASWPATRTHAEGELEVYRMDDEGGEVVRCLCFMPIVGYMVEPSASREWFPPNINCGAFRNGEICYRTAGYSISERERERILDIYPDFKWTLAKDTHHHSPAYVMRLLMSWKRNPKTELLVAARLDKLVGNGNFLRMREEKQKAVLAFIRQNTEAAGWTLRQIQFVMQGRTAEEYRRWVDLCGMWGYYPFEACRRYGFDHAALKLYQDYIGMAKECGHDMADPYWKWPKDLKKAHDKVMREVRLVREARRLEQKAAEKKAEAQKAKKFEAFAKKFSLKVSRAAGFTAYVPADIKTVSRQAKALNQCLIYCDYIGKMATRKCLLVFIAGPDGNPSATAEILSGGKVAQFYANEKKPDMGPCRQASAVLTKWLKKWKPRFRKETA